MIFLVHITAGKGDSAKYLFAPQETGYHNFVVNVNAWIELNMGTTLTTN